MLISVQLGAVPLDWQERWRQDLDYLAAQLREIHPQPFAKVDEAVFDSELARIRDDLAALEHHEVVVELATLLARLGDGHSRVTLPLDEQVEFFQGHSPTPPPEVDGLRFRAFPIRLSLLGGELYVREVAPAHRELLGARVVRFGKMSIEGAIAAVAPTVRRDNELQIQDLLPTHLVLVELLAARGVVDQANELPLVVERRGGERVQAVLRPQVAGGPALLVAGVDRREDAPRYPDRPEEPYWFEWLDDHILYFQFNQVGGAEGETLDRFTTRLLTELDRQPGSSLVIDLRRNPGGWYGTAKSLLRGLLRRELVDEPGRLLVLTGRTTFSAAMMFAIDLERHSNALFLGEPTGSSPNHHGDARRVRLPNSGITVRISTLYWQSHPSDRREFITPHVTIEPTFDDYLAGRDPVLDAAVAIATSAEAAVPAGSWSGRMSFPLSAGVPLSLELQQERGGGLGATWSWPQSGVLSQPLEKVSWDGRRLVAAAPWQGGNVTRIGLEADLRQGYLVGIATLESEMGAEGLPFVLAAQP